MHKHYYTTKENESIALGINLPISLKYSVELAREIKNKPVKKVLKYVEDIENLEKHLPLKKHNRKVAHRKGDAVSKVKSGRYPVKVAKYFKKIIGNAINNADVKGLDKDNLIIAGAVASKGIRRFKIQPLGRRRVRHSKATNLEIKVKELGKKKKQVKKQAKPVKNTQKKVVEKKSVEKSK